MPPATVKPDSRSLFRFDAEVDWRERHEFLKCKLISPISIVQLSKFWTVELPLNIHNDNAIYETQFGYVQRPTHKNTTWDMAKVCDFLTKRDCVDPPL